jgi:hypothetical protein
MKNLCFLILIAAAMFSCTKQSLDSNKSEQLAQKSYHGKKYHGEFLSTTVNGDVITTSGDSTFINGEFHYFLLTVDFSGSHPVLTATQVNNFPRRII